MHWAALNTGITKVVLMIFVLEVRYPYISRQVVRDVCFFLNVGIHVSMHILNLLSSKIKLHLQLLLEDML